MLNEIAPKILALELKYVIVVFAIGFFTIVWRLGRLVRQTIFANWFSRKFLETMKSLNNREYDEALRLRLVRNLPRLNEDMEDHGDGNRHYIDNAITHLHNQFSDILAPDLDNVDTYLEKYIGTLYLSIRKMLFRVVCVPLWPMQVVELVVIILRVCKICDFNSSGKVARIIKILFNTYMFIAGWDAVVKTLKEFL